MGNRQHCSEGSMYCTELRQTMPPVKTSVELRPTGELYPDACQLFHQRPRHFNSYAWFACLDSVHMVLPSEHVLAIAHGDSMSMMANGYAWSPKSALSTLLNLLAFFSGSSSLLTCPGDMPDLPAQSNKTPSIMG